MVVLVGLVIVYWIGSEMNKDRFVGVVEMFGGSVMVSVGNFLGDVELECCGCKYWCDGKICNILGLICEIVGFDVQFVVGIVIFMKF